MKKKKIVSVVMALMIISISMVGLTGCGSKESTYSMSYTDAVNYVSASIPFVAMGGEQASYTFNMMGITEVTVDVTLKGDEYTYVSYDVGNTDPDNGLYWDRTSTFIGALSESNDTYTLSTPTSVTSVLKYGADFDNFKEIFGEQGTYTEADTTGQDLIGRFNSCTATNSDDTITFILN